MIPINSKKNCDHRTPLCPVFGDLGMRQFSRLTQTRHALTCDVKLKKSRSLYKENSFVKKNELNE